MNESGIVVMDQLKPKAHVSLPIECQSVWKVFGRNNKAAMQSILENGLDKARILHDFDCAVGVADVSLKVEKGETFCIMGLSGSGKSTLVRLLNRLIEPTQGQVLIQGTDIRNLDKENLRKMRANHIGMVFQNVALLPFRTTLENVAFGLEVRNVPKRKREAIAREALAKVGLAEWSERYPDELSGGMQQRVGLARALAADPEILLMDEPFSALDPIIRKQLQDEFRQLSQKLGKTTVFITHDLEEAIRIGDRIAIMKDGAIIQLGTPEEIVLFPETDYVANFVEGISRIHLVKAASIMIAPDQFNDTNKDFDLSALPCAAPTSDLHDLIVHSISNQNGQIAIIEDEKIIGVVTREAILQAVIGSGTEGAAQYVTDASKRAV